MTAVVPTLDFIFRITVRMGARERYDAQPNGMRRGYTSVAGGTIEGPALTGTVVPNSGGDYPLIDRDGNARLSAQYYLEADDGTRIYMHNRGYRHSAPEVNIRLQRNEPVPMTDYYFRLSPVFEAPSGRYDWLNHTIVVGSADRREDNTVFDYYAVR